MRNNEERIGTQKNIHQPEPILNNQQNQQLNLNFISPTEIVDLPSQGMFYPEDHPLKQKTSIEIKQMTAKEEDILTNRSLLKKGVALERLLESLVVDKSINPLDLLTCDRNAIFLSARISAYGRSYSTQVVCPACEKKSKYSFDLLEKIEIDEEQKNKMQVSVDSNGLFKIELPSTKWVVECRSLNGHDEKKLLNANQQSKDQFTLLEQLKLFVVSIQGATDPAILKQALENLPANDSRFLRKQYDSIVPSLQLEGTFVCKDCDYEEVLEVPLTAEFFWPK